MSVAEHLEIRRRIADGQTFAVAAAAVGCSTTSIQRLLIQCGGLPPPARARSALRLSCSGREELSRGLRAGDSLRAVASRLGRSPSTISREVIANGNRQRYRAWRAERTAMRRARRPTALGFSVIPLDHPAETTQTDPKRIGKVPALSSWKAFQTARPTDNELVSWFGNGHQRNLAVVTGAVSRIVVIDCDSADAIALADEHLPPTPMITRTAKEE